MSERTPGGTRTPGEETYQTSNRTHEVFRRP